MTLTFESIKKIQFKMKEIMRNTPFYLLFLIAIILLSFGLYIVIFASPSGTDVYSHMFNTQNMAQSTSLSEYYEKSLNMEYSGIDYPFGMWYFGSLTMKITGLDVYAIAYIIPLLLLFVTLVSFFCYAYELTKSSDQSLLSLIFLVSMTQMALALLNYSTSTFVMPFLVTILFLGMRDIEWKNVILIGIIVFTLCFTHTGTFLFLITFAVTYLLLRALIWGKFDNNFFLVISALIFCFIIAVELFPFIQQQYIDKGTLIISTSKSISSATRITFFKDAGQVFYDTIFVANNYVFAILWVALMFVAGKLMIIFHSIIRKRISWKKMLAAIPFIENITTVSKGIIMTPFWVGPLHALLSVIGVFKLNERGKCIALTLIFSSLIPGILAGSVGTGSTRETFYLFLLIPITAALGFYHILPLINRISGSGVKRAVTVVFYLIIFVPLIAVPVIACLHYQPPITMTKEENVNLEWLGNIGNPTEGAAATGYRDRMTMYANKTVPSIASGSETVRFLNDLQKTYFSHEGESYARDLSNYQIQYLITSDRVLKGYVLPRSAITIDTNKEIDKIYASGNFFGFYKIISQPEIPKTDLNESLTWDTQQPGAHIQDVGSVFLFENSVYKVKVSDTSPKIRYIGTPTNNFLGEGAFSDNIGIEWGTIGNDAQYSTYNLGSLSYSEIQRSDNEIVYKTKLFSKNKTPIASLSVKYIFNDLAVKREITVMNDLDRENRTPSITLYIISSVFSPMTDFEFHQMNPGAKKWVKKMVYPSEDEVSLGDTIVDKIFLNNVATGLYILYDDTAPYPNTLSYYGSPYYDYGIVSLESAYNLHLSESVTIGQYLSVNNKKTAIKNAEKYNSVSLYPFQDAQIPVIVYNYESDTKFNTNEQSALTMLNQNHVPYTMGIPKSISAGALNMPGIIPSGYFNPCYNKTLCKNFTTQREELKVLKQNTSTTGILMSQIRYDLNTTRSLSENQYNYAELKTVPAPLGPYYREGIRVLKYASVDGENTGIVLIPVTEPPSSVLNSRSETDAIFSEWNKTINSVRQEGGIAVFLWDLSDIGNPEFIDQFDGFINYSISKGMTFTTMDAVALHVKKLESVRVNVSRGEENVILNARNTEGQPVSGITYELIMPVIENTCSYTITNGTIARYDINGDECRVYASFSLNGYESKEIKIESAITNKQLFPYIPELYQGKNTIKISDENNQPIPNVSVFIDSQYYQTTNKGQITFMVNYGERTIKIEKPGYNSVTINTYVKPLFYRYISFFRIK